MDVYTTNADERDSDDRADGPALEKDDVFHLLQSERRRAALRYFASHPEQDTFEMRTLAEVVTAWENETTVDRITSDQRQRVYIALYQSHLPKLDDYGVIEYDQARGTIEPTDRIGLLLPYLEDEFRTDRTLAYRNGSSAFGFESLKQLLDW